MFKHLKGPASARGAGKGREGFGGGSDDGGGGGSGAAAQKGSVARTMPLRAQTANSRGPSAGSVPASGGSEAVPGAGARQRQAWGPGSQDSDL
jgi:hypothetical protein